jgi:long-chain acyl-CoA synthetase
MVDLALHVGARVAEHRRAGRRVPLPISALHHLLDAVVLQRFRAPFGGAIRFMVSGSAPLPPAVMQFFEAAGLLILEAYGFSENIVPIAVNRPADYRAGSVGKPLPPNEVRLAVDGEVLVRSPGLFSGYENGATAAQLVDGFYATGDFGEFDGDGFLFLRGRKSELLKTSTGRRIAPSRIELLLRQIPGVDQALAFGDGREVLVGMLALEPGQATQEVARAVQSVNERLADYERIRGLLLLRRGLTVASGELTSNL